MLFRKKIDRYCTYCQFAGKIAVSYTHLRAHET